MSKESDPTKIKNDTYSSISIHMPGEDELSKIMQHCIIFVLMRVVLLNKKRMSIPLHLAKSKELHRNEKPSL